ncbi:hypothetical protein PWR63_19345 [Paraburkholderia sp. A2WS-5]|uniref:hypothetical protein n=1 Tax=unclassified Paraburkholderia TaxID=2615204 RepID=UPI003B7DE813
MLNKILGRGAKEAEPQPAATEQEPQKLFDREQTTSLTVTTSRGPVDVLIKTFSAMAGWEIKTHAKDFYSANTRRQRRFKKAVLAHASIGGVTLKNEQAANDLLERWPNVEAVFEAVLEHNGIEMDVAFVMANEIDLLGVQIGKAFIAAHERILEPVRKMAVEGGKE